MHLLQWPCASQKSPITLLAPDVEVGPHPVKPILLPPSESYLIGTAIFRLMIYAFVLEKSLPTRDFLENCEAFGNDLFPAHLPGDVLNVVDPRRANRGDLDVNPGVVQVRHVDVEERRESGRPINLTPDLPHPVERAGPCLAVKDEDRGSGFRPPGPVDVELGERLGASRGERGGRVDG